MVLNIQDIFPNYTSGLNQIGFFFGAGTSKEAGFPLTIDLTKSVINELGSSEIKLLEDIFRQEKMDFSYGDGNPDIEVISNLVYKHLLLHSFEGIERLEESIRKNIYSQLTSIKEPNLEDHILFLKALKNCYIIELNLFGYLLQTMIYFLRWLLWKQKFQYIMVLKVY